MNMIDRFDSVQDLLSLRDHVGKVLSTELNLPLKSRKLNELTAKLVGVADFNTAQAMVVNKQPVESTQAPVDIVLDISNGDLFLYSNVPVRGVVIDDNKDEVASAQENHVPNVIKNFVDRDVAYWRIGCEGNEGQKVGAQHYIDQVYSGEKPEPYFPATLTSDDQNSSTEFNAYPYFKDMSVEAVAEAISQLDAEGWVGGWSGGYASDAVAEALRSEPGFESIDWVFDYIDSVNDNNEHQGRDRDQGFTVWIDPEPVRAWFKTLS
jgi:hypothetical protein